MTQFIIPLWFYSFDPPMYVASALIGFLLSFYFHRIYSISRDKKHMYLQMGFLLLSISLLTVGMANAYVYFAFSQCQHSCTLGFFDNVFSLDDYAYFIYFGLSIFAYLLFWIAYKPRNSGHSKMLMLALLAYLLLVALLPPVSVGSTAWHEYYGYFNLTAFVILLFISFRSAVNYIDKRTASSLFVMLSFGFISLSHLIRLFSSFNELMYVLAHISLLIGFGFLLIMVSRRNST